MKIAGLQVDHFGIWSQVQFDNLAPGVTVFYGPNEAGKTTLLQFVRMVLYGFNAGRAKRYLQSAGQGMLSAGRRIGGSIVISTRDDDYHVRRYASQTNPLDDLAGELRVTTRDGSRQGGHRLTHVLSGIDEPIFNNVYAVGLREMQYLGTLNDTQASRYLYNLSTGTDRVSLVDVMRQLQTTRSHLIGSADADSMLATLVGQQDEIAGELRSMTSSLDRWIQQRSELEHLDEEIARIESGRAAAARRLRYLELAARVQPIWEQHRQIEQQIHALGSIPAISNDTQRELEDLTQQMAIRQQELQQHQTQRTTANATDHALDDEAFIHNAIRLEAILDDRPTIAALDDQLFSLKQRLDEADFELQAEFERLGLASRETGSVPQFDEHVLASLREPASRVESHREELEQAKKESTRLKEEAKTLVVEMAEALGHDRDWLDRGQDPSALISSGDHRTGNTQRLAADLRRRLHLEKSRITSKQDLKRLSTKRKTLLANQLLPWEVLQALGALFALSVLCLALALFGATWEFADRSRIGMAILGLVGLASSGALKLLLNGSSQTDLHNCVADIEECEKQLLELEKESRALDQRIPGKWTDGVSVGSIHDRLMKVESLMPLDGRRRSMLEAADAYEQRAIQLAHRLKAAREQWTESLAHFGLSANLSPAQIQQLTTDAGHVAQLNRVSAELKDEVSETQRELAGYRQRLGNLFSELRLVPKGDRVVDQLNQLALARQAHEQRRKQAENRRDAERQLRDREQSLTRELRQLNSRRATMIAAQGAVDDDSLRELINRRQQWEALIQQRDARNEDLAKLLTDKAASKTVIGELVAEGGDTVAERLKALQADSERTDLRIKELLLRRGELAERCRQLAEDRGPAEKMLDLAQLNAKLDQAVEQTQTVSAIMHLLRHVYKRYEKDRQPETLKEASDHLRRMTQEKYTRIWTPLDDDTLFVDDPNRLSIPVDQLSRGTREQLFLALRLALVSGYARRGCDLPLILDDVLVNFDIERTRSAAELLIEFGHAGHQVLVFTCHEHVMEMFGELGADVRRLPEHSSSSRHEAVAKTVVQNKFVQKKLTEQSLPQQESRRRITSPRREGRALPEPALVATASLTEFMIGYDDGDSADFVVGYDGPANDDPTESEWTNESSIETESHGFNRAGPFPGDWHGSPVDEPHQRRVDGLWDTDSFLEQPVGKSEVDSTPWISDPSLPPPVSTVARSDRGGWPTTRLNVDDLPSSFDRSTLLDDRLSRPTEAAEYDSGAYHEGDDASALTKDLEHEETEDDVDESGEDDGHFDEHQTANEGGTADQADDEVDDDVYDNLEDEYVTSDEDDASGDDINDELEDEDEIQDEYDANDEEDESDDDMDDEFEDGDESDEDAQIEDEYDASDEEDESDDDFDDELEDEDESDDEEKAKLDGTKSEESSLDSSTVSGDFPAESEAESEYEYEYVDDESETSETDVIG